jgi:hypothetical protein
VPICRTGGESSALAETWGKMVRLRATEMATSGRRVDETGMLTFYAVPKCRQRSKSLSDRLPSPRGIHQIRVRRFPLPAGRPILLTCMMASWKNPSELVIKIWCSVER